MMNDAGDLSTQGELIPIEHYPDLAVDWTQLESHSDCSPFVSWTWVSTWLRHLPQAFRPIVFRARDRDGVLALGLLVDVPERGARRLFGTRSIYLQETGDSDIDEITIEFAGLLLRRGAEIDGYAALFHSLTQSDRSWRRLRISGSTAVEAVTAALPADLRAFSVDARASYIVNLAALRARGANYVSGLGTRTRHGLRRARRAYEAFGELRTEVVGTPQDAVSWLGELRTLHERRWLGKGQPGSFGSAFFVDFHRDLVAAGTTTGFTQLMRITAGPIVIGYLYNIIWRKRVYFYNGGLNYGALKPNDRPGYVAQLLAIERHLADGMDIYDFMAGDQEYKRTLGTDPQMLHWLEVRPRGWRVTTEHLLSRLIHGRTIGSPLPAPASNFPSSRSD